MEEEEQSEELAEAPATAQHLNDLEQMVQFDEDMEDLLEEPTTGAGFTEEATEEHEEHEERRARRSSTLYESVLRRRKVRSTSARSLSACKPRARARAPAPCAPPPPPTFLPPSAMP